MKRTLKQVWLWLVIASLGTWTLTALTACNTTEGVGEDIEDAGEGIQDAAD